MCGIWLEDIESLEAISQDEETRRLVLRMAAMSGSGGLQPFLRALAADGDLDETTKGALAELARNPAFLHAVEDYVRRTRLLH